MPKKPAAKKAAVPRVAIAAAPAAAATAAEPDTRDRVLLEAARLFRYQGYAATTLRQVADAAGVKAGSIYYHFESKEVILGEVLDKGMLIVTDAVRERVEALPADASWRDKIAAGITAHLWGMLHYGDFTSANIRIYGQIPATAKSRHRIVRRVYADYWDRMLVAARDAGELRQDVDTTVIRLFLIGALNWTVEWYNPQRGSLQDLSRQIVGVVFDGILDPSKR